MNMQVEDLPQRGVYPATESVIDWLSHKFEAIDQGVFVHFRGLRKIVKSVDRAEGGSVIHRLKARSALREYNETHETDVRWTDVKHRTTNYVPAFAGDWVAFTDNSKSILEDPEDGSNYYIEDALYGAPMDVRWAIIWDPMECIIVVYRSPVLKDCLDIDQEQLLSCGMTQGDRLSFVLPSEIEGAIRQDVDRMENDNQPSGVISEHALMNPPARVENISITEFLSWAKW